jgi:hypothetical protein
MELVHIRRITRWSLTIDKAFPEPVIQESSCDDLSFLGYLLSLLSVLSTLLIYRNSIDRFQLLYTFYLFSFHTYFLYLFIYLYILCISAACLRQAHGILCHSRFNSPRN